MGCGAASRRNGLETPTSHGVSKALLAAALRAMKEHGCKIVEGYPLKPGKDGQYIAAFSWTGTQSLFSKAGFRVVGNKDGGKQRVRLCL